MGVRGGGAGATGSGGAALPRRRLAGEGHPGAPVADSGRGLALRHARGTRNPLEVVARGYGVRSGVLGGVGGSVWRRFAGERRTST